MPAVTRVAAGQGPVGGAVPVGELYGLLERELLAAMAALDDATARQGALARGEAVICRLHVALDVRGGGELARRLSALYGYFSAEMGRMRGVADVDGLDELLELTVTLRRAAEAQV